MSVVSSRGGRPPDSLDRSVILKPEPREDFLSSRQTFLGSFFTALVVSHLGTGYAASGLTDRSWSEVDHLAPKAPSCTFDPPCSCSGCSGLRGILPDWPRQAHAPPAPHLCVRRPSASGEVSTTSAFHPSPKELQQPKGLEHLCVFCCQTLSHLLWGNGFGVG